MREHSKKEFKQKIKWFIDNKNSMSRTRRAWALAGMEERYAEFVSYKKYGRYGSGVKEYIAYKIREMMKEGSNNGN